MKLPWVSRLAFEQACALAETCRVAAEHWEQHATRIAERATADLERADQRYTDLLSRYHMLKLQGAHEAPPPPPMKLVTPDPILKAIADRAPDERTRKAMLAQVEIDKAAGLSAPEIVARIYAGNRPAADVA